MRTVPESVLRELLAKWKPLTKPVYRFATCWDCGRKLIFGMWHCPLPFADAHLCRTCFTKRSIDVD